MAAKYEESRDYSIDFNTALKIMRWLDSTDLNISLKSENPVQDGSVWFRYIHGMSFRSYGEKITITLRALAERKTNIHIHSECGMPTQIFDSGKNKSNVCNIYSKINSYISLNNCQSPIEFYQTTANISESTPQKSENTTSNFCIKCGAKLNPDDNFCIACGNRIK